MAAVYDEHDTLVGIITLENVIEQIVGSVQDEFDSEQPNIDQKEDGTFQVKGSTPVFLVNRKLGLKLESPQDIDTMSGLVTHILGRPPKSGDELNFPRSKISILEIKGQRVSLLMVKLLDIENTDED